MKKYDYVVLGSGIIGLSIAYEILKNKPNSKLIVIEKSSKLGDGQTGHNSGVIHSGIYYDPESLKSKLCLEGHNLLVEYLKLKNIPFKKNGKFIVSNSNKESTQLDDLEIKAKKSNIAVDRLNKIQLKKIDPEIVAIDALSVKSTKTVDYLQVLKFLKNDLIEMGADFLFNSYVKSISGTEVKIKEKTSIFCKKKIIVAVGLGVDRIKSSKKFFTVGFKGRYLKSKRFRKGLALVYPAPNPKLPFLGVHTCMQSDNYEFFGPNAILSLQKTPIRLYDFFNNYFFKIGFYKVLLSNWKIGLKEILLNNSDFFFKKELSKIIKINNPFFEQGFFGIRAQCIASDGSLVDDFVIEESGNTIVLRNVPSPAATSSFAIAKYVLKKIEI